MALPVYVHCVTVRPEKVGFVVVPTLPDALLVVLAVLVEMEELPQLRDTRLMFCATTFSSEMVRPVTEQVTEAEGQEVRVSGGTTMYCSPGLHAAYAHWGLNPSPVVCVQFFSEL